eukprot:2676528-Lingulodinium_polyedra.AAC.1
MAPMMGSTYQHPAATLLFQAEGPRQVWGSNQVSLHVRQLLPGDLRILSRQGVRGPEESRRPG